MPTFAQTAGASMTAADVGVQPLSGLSAADYVKLAADSDKFEIESGKIAARRANRQDVKGFARQMVTDHTQSTAAIKAALSNKDRKITPPALGLSSAKQAQLDLLKKAPKASFDQLYLQQQLEAHQAAWALQAGYADNGSDPALKQVATTIVPTVEHHLSSLKGMSGAM